MIYDPFLTTATGGKQPCDYQRQLAQGSACQSWLIEIPTGRGEIAPVVLA